jgi:hypothetical protein
VPPPPSLEAILGAIETRLDTIQGLSVGDMVPAAINPPQAVVGVPEIGDYHTGVAALRTVLRPTITVLVSSAMTALGQHQLARYADLAGPQSIPALILADRTLGGVVSDCLVRSFRPLGLQDVGIVGYFGGVFTLSLNP